MAGTLTVALHNPVSQDTELVRATSGDTRTRPLKVGPQLRISTCGVVAAIFEALFAWGIVMQAARNLGGVRAQPGRSRPLGQCDV